MNYNGSINDYIRERIFGDDNPNNRVDFFLKKAKKNINKIPSGGIFTINTLLEMKDEEEEDEEILPRKGILLSVSKRFSKKVNSGEISNVKRLDKKNCQNTVIYQKL